MSNVRQRRKMKFILIKNENVEFPKNYQQEGNIYYRTILVTGSVMPTGKPEDISEENCEHLQDLMQNAEKQQIQVQSQVRNTNGSESTKMYVQLFISIQETHSRIFLFV